MYNCGTARQAIFAESNDYDRFVGTMRYYRDSHRLSYAQYLNYSRRNSDMLKNSSSNLVARVSLVAYCLMPNHFHIVLRQITINGITRFLSDLQNSYTRYYNVKYSRLGSLFQGTFKAKTVNSSASLINLSRYIHLNPVYSHKYYGGPARFTPSQYIYSSYRDWLEVENQGVINRSEVADIVKGWGGIAGYRDFVENSPNRNPLDGIENQIIEV